MPNQATESTRRYWTALGQRVTNTLLVHLVFDCTQNHLLEPLDQQRIRLVPDE